MRVSIICTGTELLKGTTVNTNLAFLGQQLAEIGIVPFRALIVGDSAADMRQALEAAAADSDLIITTGGLGPTRDDLTRNAVCDFLGLKLERDFSIVDDLKRRWAKRYSTVPREDYLTQADVPENSTVLKNRIGTAPGLWVKGKVQIILLPGPPHELNPMFRNEAMPLLKKLAVKMTYTVGFMIASISELIVQDKIEPLVKDLPISLAYCASIEGVKVFLSSEDKDLVRDKAAEAAKLFGDALLADNQLAVVPEVFARLQKSGYTLGLAESCTGGLIAAAITDLPGASQIFKGAIISYSNAVKNKLLEVPQNILDNYGAVSRECVEAMVQGAAKNLEVDAAIAVSGIAGPDGGTPEKPVGTVHIAAFLQGKIITENYVFPGSRESIRERAKIRALLLLRQLLIENP
ncbi:MAG: CinA family nicotinamide mononucleotide deamidase-related protein [Victivallaceae bacterium]